MISEYEVVSQLHNSFNIIWITFLQQQQKFCFNCRLIIIFFLILYQFDSNQLFMFMIQAFDYLTKSSLSNDFDKLVSVANVVPFLYLIVSLLIIKTIIHEPLKFCRLYFGFIRTQKVNLFIFFNLCFFKIGQELISNFSSLCCLRIHWKL